MFTVKGMFELTLKNNKVAREESERVADKKENTELLRVIQQAEVMFKEFCKKEVEEDKEVFLRVLADQKEKLLSTTDETGKRELKKWCNLLETSV